MKNWGKANEHLNEKHQNLNIHKSDWTVLLGEYAETYFSEDSLVFLAGHIMWSALASSVRGTNADGPQYNHPTPF